MCHNNKKFDEEEQTVKSQALQQQSLCKQKICKYLSYLHITANMVAWSNLPKIFKLLDIGVCTSWIRNIKLHNVWKRLKYRFILINFHWLTQKKNHLLTSYKKVFPWRLIKTRSITRTTQRIHGHDTAALAMCFNFGTLSPLYISHPI